LGARPVPVGRGAAPASASTRQVLAGLRKELNGLIAAWHHRTSQPHGAIHADLRRACGGPPLPEATAEQIQARIEMLRRWASGR
ncbi:MAG: ATP-dependent helicase, partial [Streptosporangiaceae bacterium]